MTNPPQSEASKVLIVGLEVACDLVASAVFLYWAFIIFLSARNNYKFGSGDRTQMYVTMGLQL